MRKNYFKGQRLVMKTNGRVVEYTVQKVFNRGLKGKVNYVLLKTKNNRLFLASRTQCDRYFIQLLDS